MLRLFHPLMQFRIVWIHLSIYTRCRGQIKASRYTHQEHICMFSQIGKICDVSEGLVGFIFCNVVRCTPNHNHIFLRQSGDLLINWVSYHLYTRSWLHMAYNLKKYFQGYALAPQLSLLLSYHQSPQFSVCPFVISFPELKGQHFLCMRGGFPGVLNFML